MVDPGPETDDGVRQRWSSPAVEPETTIERLYAILLSVAHSRGTISDREIMARMGWNDHGPTRSMFLLFLLKSIGYGQCRIGSIPILPAIVVSDETGEPLEFSFELSREFNRLGEHEDLTLFWLRELGRVYEFWGNFK